MGTVVRAEHERTWLVIPSGTSFRCGSCRVGNQAYVDGGPRRSLRAPKARFVTRTVKALSLGAVPVPIQAG